jgi:hypothetical protein
VAGDQLAEPDPKRKPLVQSSLRMQAALGDAFGQYTAMRRREDWDGARALLEELAVRWRRTAELDRLEQFGDDFLVPEAIELLAALESSLVVAEADDPDRRYLMLSGEEVALRMLPVGASGIWGQWEEVLDTTWREQEHVAGRPPSDRPDDWPPTPKPRKRPRRTDEQNTLPVGTLLEGSILPAVEVYYRLDPHGRALSAAQRSDARSRLLDLEIANRTVDLVSEGYSAKDWAQMLLWLAFMRSLARSFVLTLSDDGERRALAMTPSEVHMRAFMARARLEGATHAEAYRLYQASEEASQDP